MIYKAFLQCTQSLPAVNLPYRRYKIDRVSESHL